MNRTSQVMLNASVILNHLVSYFITIFNSFAFIIALSYFDNFVFVIILTMKNFI